MSNDDNYIKAKYDAYLYDWVGSALGIGSLVVILLIPLDYLVTPSNFKTFLVYRSITSLSLLILYALNRRKVNEIYQSAISIIAGIIVSAMVAMMIYKFQGHRSPYFAGIILTAIFGIGFIPLRLLPSLFVSLLIYLIYLLPILIYDTITDTSFFISANSLMVFCISSLLVLRYLAQKRLMKEFSLQYQVEQREQQLAESQRIAHIGSWERNLTTGLLFWSDQLFRLLGLDPKTDPADFKMFFDMVHPDDQPTLKKAIDEAVRLHAPFNIDYRVILKNGLTRVLHAQAELIHDDTGTQTILRGTAQDITERKLAEEHIHQNEERLKVALNTVDMAVFSQDLDLSYIWMYRPQLGYATGQVIGKLDSELLPPDLAQQATKLKRQVLETGEGRRGEVEGIVNDKRICYYLIVEPLRDTAGQIIGITGASLDITERKRTEEALRISEERLSLALQAAEQGIYDLDLRTGEAVVTPEYAFMLGYDPDEFHETNAKWIERLHPDDRDTVAAIYRAYVKGGIPEYKVEFRQKTKNGNWKWILSLGKIMKRDTDGIPLRMIGTHTDITERKRAEAEIADRSALLQQIMDTASVAIYLLDRTGRITHANRCMTEMFGRTLDELLDSEYVELVHPSERETAQKNMLALLASKIPSVDLERLYCRKDGTPFWGHLACRRFHDVHGNELGLIGVITDISVRKRAEEVLRENQARLDLALQSAHMGVWRWEIKENRRYFDGLTCQLLGINAATFTGTADEFFRVVHPEDREKVKAALAWTIEQDTLYKPTYRVVWPEGNVHCIAARGKLIRDDKGQPERINGILWDITDQHLLEQELIKTQKLESIGTLAGGIAHDFNNLLQGIFGYISMAKLTHDQKEKSLAMLEQAEKALHQSVNLTSQLLTFSKGGKPVKKVVDLRPVIENSVAFAMSGSSNTYEIITDEDLRAVEADEGQIGQVIQNIVLNAEQSMPLGGMIRVSVRNMPAQTILPRADLQGNLVEILIRDQGTGIPAEHLTRIFDPYFTTKEKGSGLGLATSYSIIRNHGGIIDVASEPGKGTTFSVYLPAIESEKEISEAPAVSSVVRKGTILVMDDEDLIRNIARELIMALGHDVDLAENGEDAIAQYQTTMKLGKPYDIVILDLTVRGGLGGREAIERLLAIDPGVRAIVSSGYSGDAVLSDYQKYGFKARLTKPYNIGELRDTLNDLLN